MRSVLLIIMLMVFGVYGVPAQLPTPKLSEFFGQKKKQTKRLVEQVALLQVYIGVLKKGYHIVEDGLNLINDIKHGDFSIHNGYFTSLKNVKPVIKNYSKVNGIMDGYEQIAQLYRQATKIVSSGWFSSDERDAVERIFTRLLTEANKNLVALKSFTTSGNFELKDDERLQRIEGLWVDMQDKYAFAKDFTHSVALLQGQKQREDQEAKRIQGFSDLK